jgi:hypothetical protein
MKEFSNTYAVVDDAYMNVEFNPNYVKSYRLVGFDNKVGALKDIGNSRRWGNRIGIFNDGDFRIESAPAGDTVMIERYTDQCITGNLTIQPAGFTIEVYLILRTLLILKRVIALLRPWRCLVITSFFTYLKEIDWNNISLL